VKCIATTLLLGSVFFGSCGQLRAGTVAYWRFEDGTAGTEHAGDQDNWYQDISGNGNHLSSWWDQARPMATADRPFTTVPQTGAANNLALDFDRGAEGADDLVTGPAVKMIDSYLFSGGWTIEASFKPRAHWWQVIVGKDGHPDPDYGEQPFCFKVRADNHKLECRIFDNNGDIHWIYTWKPLELNKWYSVAATYDNTTFNLYLKAEGDSDYVLQGTLVVPAGAAMGQSAAYWTVGRGMWGGGTTDFFDGLIDEVSISDTALVPSEFLGSN